jgi:hypothetical protein
MRRQSIAMRGAGEGDHCGHWVQIPFGTGGKTSLGHLAEYFPVNQDTIKDGVIDAARAETRAGKEKPAG